VEFLRGEVEELLENGEPEQALQDTLHYGSIEVFGIDTVNSYYIRAVEQLASQLRQSSEQEHYDAALRRYDSLARLVEDARAVFPALEELAADAGALPGAETLDQYARDELQARQAVSLLESGNDALALTALTALESWEHLETAQLERFSEAALSQQNRFALERLERVLESRGGTMPEEAAALLERQPSPNEMVPGTVTVWVDQGIRIQQGAGVPDRVIGSGFFIDKRGYLLTNYHIVRSQVDPEYEGYSRLYVRLPGNPDQRVPAQVVGYDRIFDVALLKTPIEPDYTFSFTQIRELDPGTSILTIGSPGGLQSSISSGIISATDRRFLQIGEVLQVDLPVNPGNSGGPVFDQSGRLVGVVFAGIEQFEGVNFAIPSYWVRPLLSRLYEEGEVRHPWLGVSVAERSGSLEVTYVSRGSPADEVGLEVGDHIQSVNGTDVSRIPQAQDLLLRSGVNQLMSLRIRRDGEQRKTMVALAERPHRPVLKAIEAEQISEVFAPLFGMTTNEVGRFPWQQEFVVTDVYPGTIADETGLSENDPFSLLDWRYNEERRAVGIEIVVRKRKAGFLETAVQLAAPVETNNFL
jgi:S1-C subfamily serine protease